MADSHNGFPLIVAMVVLLLLSGCGSGQGQSDGATAPVQIAVVFNQSQAGQLTQTEPNIATIRVDISGPDLAPRTSSVPVNPASKEIDISVNAPAGSNRTIYLAALNAANDLLFSGSVSGVTLPAAGPVQITVVLPFRVTINKQGTGSGTVTASPSGFDCGSNCLDFDGGTLATFTASAAPGSTFAGWSGGGCSGTGSCTVGSSVTIAAIFNAVVNTATLTVTKSGTGTGTVTSNPSGISCGNSCSASFAGGTSVTLSATATGGSTFAGWGGACSGNTTTCVVLMNSNQTVAATFNSAASNTLTVNKIGTGTVTSNPAGIDCGASCSASFVSGTSVTLTATPTAGATFAGWGGGCSGNTPTCVVVMNGNQIVTATFNAPPNSLTINKTGTGTGTVTSSPAGINCGTTCTAGFTTGTAVTLTATPAAGSTFTNWSGPCSGTGTCIVVMNSSQTVTATFTASPISATLTVTKGGSGSGTVTSSPAGINCGSTCSAAFNTGGSVTLLAAAATGSIFAGWSGGGCSGTGSCVVVMNSNQTVTAMFNPPSMATLTLNKNGTGTGTVTSSPTGINCTAACSSDTGSFASGTSVKLTATAVAGSTFAGWSGGGCSGTGTCTTVMSADQTVVAQFNLTANTNTLTVTKSGSGSGTVTSSPSGINCGLVCAFAFTSGTSVTLTATPAAGNTFGGWSGSGCSGTGTCVVVMDQNRSVSALFNP